MIKHNVNLGDRSYPIYITTDYSELPKCLSAAKISSKIVVITDKNVYKYQGDECINALENFGYEVLKYVIEPGEASKNLDTVKGIYEFLISNKLDRKTTLLALGGGVVGDITGFVAATFLRGVNFVQVPTSLLAQADSSVGGKVGVDFLGSKNIIGAFYQPKLVYMNVNTLKTLPKRELASGLAEVIKHGIIRDAEFLDYIDFNINRIYSFDTEVLQYMSKVNCSIKASVVEEDEKEGGLRAILNFGHTIGHAIESMSNFKLSHGECVAIGMVGASKLAVNMGMVEDTFVSKVQKVLIKAGLPIDYNGIEVDEIYNQMFYDKKVKDSKLHFILPTAIGVVQEVVVNDEELLKNVIEELKNQA